MTARAAGWDNMPIIAVATRTLVFREMSRPLRQVLHEEGESRLDVPRRRSHGRQEVLGCLDCAFGGASLRMSLCDTCRRDQGLGPEPAVSADLERLHQQVLGAAKVVGITPRAQRVGVDLPEC